MLGRRRAAHLVGRTGLGAGRCSRTAAAAVGAVEHDQGQLWDMIRRNAVRLDATGGFEEEADHGLVGVVSRTYPAVKTVGLR